MNFTFSKTSRAWVVGMVLAMTAGAEAKSAERSMPKVDACFKQWDHLDSPGAAVVIVKDGAVIYEKGYGSANLEQHTPITKATRFDAASVAKQFTGLSVVMLVGEGKLALDAEIQRYIPYVPQFGRPITVAELAHHTSGLRDWPEVFELSGVDMTAPIPFEGILEMVRRQRELDFPPGTEHLYSNTGYNLLAAAIAKVTGKSFRAWTEENLFRPLGMKDTLFADDANEILAGRADSYEPAGAGKFKQVRSQLAAVGSSSLFISAEDMGKWLVNFETERVGGAAALKQMLEPGRLENGETVNYAFGLGLAEVDGVKIIKHTGSWAGYRSIVLRVPSKRFAVAILANVSNLNTSETADKIARALGALPAKSPAPPASKETKSRPDPAVWDSFAGSYRLRPGWVLTITREGEQMFSQATHETRMEMTAVSSNSFFVKAYGARIVFLRDQAGKVMELQYKGMHAPKLDVPPITGSDLRAAAGDYWSEELRTAVRVELREGGLAVQDRTGTWVDLVPVGKDRFDASAGEYMLQFVRSEDGRVSEVKISGSRVRNIRYKRAELPRTIR